MHILIAPNAFKNSLTAGEVALALEKGLRKSKLLCTTESFPVGDGGDGTAKLIADRFKSSNISIQVHDPLNRVIGASFWLIDNGKTALIEMADASGIRLLQSSELNPFQTSSFGTGELILGALDKGVSKIIIGLGGSATVDGGAGMLRALGIKFFDSTGVLLSAIPDDLTHLDRIDISALDPRIMKCKIIVLCDVDNYLLGNDGSAAVFGPQKGATDSDVRKLEQMLQSIAAKGFKETGRQMDKVKHGGAAGGVAAALYAFCHAELVAGAEHFLQITQFDQVLDKCEMVITGEGSIDCQSLQGKAPYAVAVMSKKRKIPVVGIAGRVPLIENKQLSKYFDVLIPIGHQPSALNNAITDTEGNLIRTGALIGNLFSLSQNK